ncbi:MAG: methionyl-tRNA formyltransferase [Candidatus Harrisonbacteria bacterium]|nr:methionyl-tRNA formyltransferase [Candidatus Harrisonbacteria bacterium]
MKYVFFGGRESKFAQIILDGLKNVDLNPIAEIRDAKKPLEPEYLKSLNADFFLVASFAKILKKEVLNINPVIGVHPSLLPKYRGPSPIQSAILNDEKETGTTLFLIDEKVDHGPALSRKSIVISYKDNYVSLEEKLAKLSAELAIETLPKYLSGEIKPQVQDEAEATYTKKFTSADAEIKISPISPIGPIAKEAWLKIRALNPEPGVFVILKLKNNKNLRLKMLDADLGPISPINPIGPIGLILKIVQPEGKKPMNYKSFLNGYQKLLP